MVLVMLDLESEKGNTLQFVHKALLGEMTICPCLDPAAFPAGDSKKVLKLVLIMGLSEIYTFDLLIGVKQKHN